MDTLNIQSLGDREARLLTKLAAEGRSVFSQAEVEAHWDGKTPLPLVLHRLADKGWLKRLQRGVYLLVPLEAGPERTWSESPLVIAPYLVKPAAVAYWSALHYWQITEQIPRLTFVQTTRRRQPLTVLGLRFRFITIRSDRFFGLAQRRVNGHTFHVTDREKTLVDCADRPDLSGGILQLAQALQAASTDLDWSRLDTYLAHWGGGAVAKRLGYLVEALSLTIPGRAERLARWQRMLTRGISRLEPAAGETGPIISRWRLRVNVTVSASGEHP